MLKNIDIAPNTPNTLAIVDPIPYIFLKDILLSTNTSNPGISINAFDEEKKESISRNAEIDIYVVRRYFEILYLNIDGSTLIIILIADRRGNEMLYRGFRLNRNVIDVWTMPRIVRILGNFCQEVPRPLAIYMLPSMRLEIDKK
ncbi:MAG: hypothetical protein QXE01_08460 [Sulfolobales archaeon]